jgi:hypothetical protein
MKHLFKIFVPLCICSFIAFGISVAVLGRVNTTLGTDTGTESGEVVITDDNLLVSSWDKSGDYSAIELDLSGYDVTLSVSNDDLTHFQLTRADGDNSVVSSNIVGNTLEVEVNNNRFVDFGTRFLDRFINAMETGSGFSDILTEGTLDINVPEKIYDTISVELDSGRFVSHGIAAKVNNFDISSGEFAFVGKEGFISDNVWLSLGSGSAAVDSLRTEKYEIDIGSGSFSIAGLSGTGSLDMGSGSGTLDFAELNGDCALDIGSGSLTVNVPENASATIYADIGSGNVNVNACGCNTALRDGESVSLGGGEHKINVDMGSGNVNITSELVSYEAIEEITITTSTTSVDFSENFEPVVEITQVDG